MNVTKLEEIANDYTLLARRLQSNGNVKRMVHINNVI